MLFAPSWLLLSVVKTARDGAHMHAPAHSLTLAPLSLTGDITALKRPFHSEVWIAACASDIFNTVSSRNLPLHGLV